ncbi:hypothetical protein CRYUN_Cryun39dG0076400 [Craigia yunnanensis]
MYTFSKNQILFLHLVLLLFAALKAHLSVGTDTIFPGQHISGNRRLTSQGQPTQTVVWVANRDQPVSDPFSSQLRLSEDGNLVLLNSSKMEIWSATKMPNMHNSTVARILDNGNFVLCKRLDPSNFVWQSFDDPIDTWLPGAKLGFNTSLRSWKFLEDPAPGKYSATLEGPRETGDIFKMNWKILYLEKGEYSIQLSPTEEGFYNILNLTYVSIEGYFCFIYSAFPPNILMRFVLDSSGQLQQFAWENFSQKWALLWAKPTFCGPFSVYNPHSVPICVCLKGFIPNMSEIRGRPQGCIRRTPLGCESGTEDRFIIVRNISYACFSDSLVAEGLIVEKIKECELACLRNCSCIAYAYDDSICLIWKGYLPYLQQLSLDVPTGKNIYVRVAASEVKIKAMTKRKTTWIAASIVIGAAITAIAVKQLKGPGESEKQFLAEVNTIGKIQHINLVHLLGFCAEASKRFLVYDYMANGSLASLLFQNHDEILNWRTIHQIAVGTARGIEYLHEKCIDCIIHCDIKPENVLLDVEYNPKVADFGLAKLLGRDFSRVLTTMRGTRGYLAPEWMSGLPISSKADVYSYGKLFFEVISRKRNMDTLVGWLKFGKWLVVNLDDGGGGGSPSRWLVAVLVEDYAQVRHLH